MNGRIYDPELGRFLSANPIVQSPKHTQSFNRYSYVWNNPLSYTDPTGFYLIGEGAGAFKQGTDAVNDAIYLASLNEDDEVAEEEGGFWHNIYTWLTENATSSTSPSEPSTSTSTSTSTPSTPSTPIKIENASNTGSESIADPANNDQGGKVYDTVEELIEDLGENGAASANRPLGNIGEFVGAPSADPLGFGTVEYVHEQTFYT